MTSSPAAVALNEPHRRFELNTNGHLSIVEFFLPDDVTLALTHTEVPAALEGQGIGSRLVEGVLLYAEQHGLQIVPLCPFIHTYIKRHSAWERVVSKTHLRSDFIA